MAERVKARRLSDEEGQRLLQIVRRGEPKMTKSVIRYRRAMVVLASASGNSVPAIARLVAADEDTVREVIHRFNELGMGALDPRWAGGRPRRISAEDEAFLIETATTRPGRLRQPFTHWSLRKLVGYLADNPRRIVRIGRERARRLLAAHERGRRQRTPSASRIRRTWERAMSMPPARAAAVSASRVHTAGPAGSAATSSPAPSRTSRPGGGLATRAISWERWSWPIRGLRPAPGRSPSPSSPSAAKRANR